MARSRTKPEVLDPERERARQHAVEVGKRLQQARKEFAGTGMLQRELADLLGVSERSVLAYEGGEVIPYRFMQKLEEYLGVSAAWLLHGQDGHSGSGLSPEDFEELKTEILKVIRTELRRGLKAS